MRPEEADALLDLEELLSKDLQQQTPERLAEGIRTGELVYDEAQKWTGLLVLELRRRGLSWSQITEQTGVDSNALRRRAAIASAERGDPPSSTSST